MANLKLSDVLFLSTIHFYISIFWMNATFVRSKKMLKSNIDMSEARLFIECDQHSKCSFIYCGIYSKDYSQVPVSPNFMAHDIKRTQAEYNIDNEIAVLMVCFDMKHIVHLHALFQASPDAYPTLAMRRVPGVSLLEIMGNHPVVPENDVRMCIRDIVRALADLHKLKVAHLDLKPQKVLLMGGRFGEGVKLCGFRLARMMSGTIRPPRDLTTDTGYKAPEMILMDPVLCGTDIWSVGVMAYEMLMGRLPFGRPKRRSTSFNILQHQRTRMTDFADSLRDHMSPEAVDFLNRCTLVRDRSNRLTAAQCLEHPWLADAPDPLLILRELADFCLGAPPASVQPSSHQ